MDKLFELCPPGRNFYKKLYKSKYLNSVDDADVLNSDAGDAIYNAGDARKNQNVPPRVLSLRCMSSPSW